MRKSICLTQIARVYAYIHTKKQENNADSPQPRLLGKDIHISARTYALTTHDQTEKQRRIILFYKSKNRNTSKVVGIGADQITRELDLKIDTQHKTNKKRLTIFRTSRELARTRSRSIHVRTTSRNRSGAGYFALDKAQQKLASSCNVCVCVCVGLREWKCVS